MENDIVILHNKQDFLFSWELFIFEGYRFFCLKRNAFTRFLITVEGWCMRIVGTNGWELACELRLKAGRKCCFFCSESRNMFLCKQPKSTCMHDFHVFRTFHEKGRNGAAPPHSFVRSTDKLQFIPGTQHLIETLVFMTRAAVCAVAAASAGRSAFFLITYHGQDDCSHSRKQNQ